MTCDNASPNDVMMQRLVDALPGFGGPRNRTRCFAHIVNLVAKSMLRLFNQSARKGKDKNEGDVDEEEDAATKAATGKEDTVDIEDLLAQLRELEAGVSDQDDPDDIYDAFANMTDDDKAKFLVDTKVVASALRKVRSFSHAVNGPFSS